MTAYHNIQSTLIKLFYRLCPLVWIQWKKSTSDACWVRTRVAWELNRDMKFRHDFLNLSCLNENKSCTKVNKSEFVWVFSTLMSWSNENKSCMRVDESWQVRVCMKVFSTLMFWSNENENWQRVKKRVCISLYNSNVPVKLEQAIDESWQARGCIAWEFSQLKCPSRMGIRVVWASLNECVMRKQESHESWWELTLESWVEKAFVDQSFLNFHVPVK